MMNECMISRLGSRQPRVSVCLCCCCCWDEIAGFFCLSPSASAAAAAKSDETAPEQSVIHRPLPPAMGNTSGRESQDQDETSGVVTVSPGNSAGDRSANRRDKSSRGNDNNNNRSSGSSTKIRRQQTSDSLMRAFRSLKKVRVQAE